MRASHTAIDGVLAAVHLPEHTRRPDVTASGPRVTIAGTAFLPSVPPAG
jgi:hypothetical protein